MQQLYNLYTFLLINHLDDKKVLGPFNGKRC